MPINLNSLPLEILTSIARYLEVDDIQRTRLACKALHDAGSPLLIKRAWISSNPEDHERLTKISRHRIFAKYVREIFYDGTIYLGDILRPEPEEAEEEVASYINDQMPEEWPLDKILQAVDRYRGEHNDWLSLQYT